MVQGSAEIELAGTAEQQTVLLSDASHYTAPNLASRVAVVTVEGAGQATVWVSERLEAQVSGAGSIGYLGDPAVSQQVSGAASLTKLGWRRHASAVGCWRCLTPPLTAIRRRRPFGLGDSFGKRGSMASQRWSDTSPACFTGRTIPRTGGFATRF